MARLHYRIRNKIKNVSRLQVGRIRRWIRAPKFPVRADSKTFLHVGCGAVDAPGFINVDLNVAPHVHVQAPIDDLSAFADRSIDLLYASHCLEHFSFLRVDEVLREWVRVLVPGGTLRVAVPDFAVIARAYDSGWSLKELQGYIMGAQTYPLNTHLTAFDEATLTEALLKAGLVGIRRWDSKHVDNHEFDDDSAHRITIKGESVLLSLNLEGEKKR